MKGTILSLAVVLLGTYALLCAFVFLFQRSLVYFPTPAVDDVPAEEVWIESAEARIRIWRLNAAKRPALVYFGGNAEDVALNVPDFSRSFPGCAVYLVNYRGYGGSTGSPSEAGLYRDAEAVYELVAGRHAPVMVMGRSLGAAVAVHVASRRDVDGLVLVTPFDSLLTLARLYYPYLPASLLLRDRYDSTDKARRIRAPVLVLAAAHDEIVPRNSTGALVDAIDPALVTFAVIESTGHNTIGLSPAYERALRRFACGRAGGEDDA